AVTKSTLFRLSLGLNAALLGVVIWQAAAHRRVDSARPRSAEALSPSDPKSSFPASDGALSQALDNLTPETRTAGGSQVKTYATLADAGVSNRPSWNWRQLESEDYRTYIKNLRSVGCPEQTVRDIVSADLFQGFAARRAEIAADRYRDFAYWKAD